MHFHDFATPLSSISSFFIYPVHDWTRDAVLGHLKIMCKQIQEMHVEFSDKN